MPPAPFPIHEMAGFLGTANLHGKQYVPTTAVTMLRAVQTVVKASTFESIVRFSSKMAFTPCKLSQGSHLALPFSAGIARLPGRCNVQQPAAAPQRRVFQCVRGYLRPVVPLRSLPLHLQPQPHNPLHYMRPRLGYRVYPISYTLCTLILVALSRA